MSTYENVSARGTSLVGWHIEKCPAAQAAGLTLVRINRDIGSWRLYPADCPDAGMMDGSATPLLAGQSNCAPVYAGLKWLSPTEADIARAAAQLRAQRHAESTGQ